ncbi:hypothetical protein CAAN1_04S04918 [[Candida] anglica]|uniref:Uncharacterized protein n=1 Tax=[Candida] anglica TaxID=148631 RepID=A0ABP0E8P0_9ASCO
MANPTAATIKVKMTAQEKEALIMKEIRASSVKYEPKFEGSFLGNIFGIAFKTTA